MGGGFVFWVCAIISVISAILVVTRRNPVYSALFLMLSFLSFAVLFIELSAPFLAAMQVMLYLGAIIVLFLFVIMLLNLKKEELGREFGLVTKILVALLCLILFVLIAKPIAYDKFLALAPQAVGTEFGAPESVGKPLFNKYVLPFELLSILIIVAIIGGVILAKKKL